MCPHKTWIDNTVKITPAGRDFYCGGDEGFPRTAQRAGCGATVTI